MTDVLDWNVAVYGVNEGARLQGCLDSVTAALAGRRALITVILNGSRDNSLEVVRAAARSGQPIEAFQIAAADKSNAINQFNHVLRSPARAYAGVDGYAWVGPQSFEAMQHLLETDPHAVAVSAIATTGRTMQRTAAAALRTGGQLGGQLHGLRRDFLDRMVARGIRLPVGLYRGDGLLNSMACHNLDAIGETWDNSRVPAVADATFAIPVLSPFKAQDIKRQYRRKIRQMRGTIENAAIKTIIYKYGYEGLPGDADAMIRDHLATHGAPPASLLDRTFLGMAIKHAASAVPFKPEDLAPHRVALD